MATKSFHIPTAEIENANIRPDAYASKRSSNGYIKISLNSEGTKLLNKATESEIEKKQKEIEELREKYSRLENIEEELREHKLSKKEKKRLKKEKKEKKKEKERLKNMPESSRILMGAIDEYSDKYFKSKKDKKNEKKFEGLTSYDKSGKDRSSDKDKAEKEKNKADKEFNQKFEEPITLLRQTIVSVDQTIDDINLLIAEAKETRAKNKSLVLKDLLLAKSSLFNNRTTNARAIGDLQKIRIELDLKKLKEGGEVNEKNRNIALISQFYPQLLNNSSKLSSNKSDKDDDDDKKGKKKDKHKKRDEEFGSKFDERATKLIKKGEIEFTPHEANIDMEGKYRVAVKKSFKDDSQWEFIAIDNHGNEIKNFKRDYPGLLPKRKNHNLRFDDEKDVCKSTTTDELFSVISVPYL